MSGKVVLSGLKTRPHMGGDAVLSSCTAQAKVKGEWR